MARKKINVGAVPAKAVGPVLVKNLHRLGFADLTIRSAELSRLVAAKTGKTMSRQRISAIANSVRVERATLDILAEAIGVETAELLKDDDI